MQLCREHLSSVRAGRPPVSASASASRASRSSSRRSCRRAPCRGLLAATAEALLCGACVREEGAPGRELSGAPAVPKTCPHMHSGSRSCYVGPQTYLVHASRRQPGSEHSPRIGAMIRSTLYLSTHCSERDMKHVLEGLLHD